MLLSIEAGASAVYKCQEKGRITYTDHPCSTDAAAATLPNLIVAAPPTRSEQALAQAHDQRIAREQSERDRDDAQWLKQHNDRRDHEARVRKAIIGHKVIKSMTMSEVKQALGEPDHVDSGDSFGTAKETWSYNEDGRTRTVNFKDGEVTTTSAKGAGASRHGRRGGKRTR